MCALRRHVVGIASAWLVCQLAGVAAAPVALWRIAAAHTDQECDCPLDAGAACPMHHKAQDEDRTCKLRSAFGNSERALLTLTGGCGVLPAATVHVSVFHPGVPVSCGTVGPIAIPLVPDAPPPRA